MKKFKEFLNKGWFTKEDSEKLKDHFKNVYLNSPEFYCMIGYVIFRIIHMPLPCLIMAMVWIFNIFKSFYDLSVFSDKRKDKKILKEIGVEKIELTWNKEIDNKWNYLYLPDIIKYSRISDPFINSEYERFKRANKIDQSHINIILYHYKKIEKVEKIDESDTIKIVAMKLWIENNRNKKLNSLLK